MKNLIMKSIFIFALTSASLAIAYDTIVDEETNQVYRVMLPSELSQADVREFCRGKMEGQILSIEGTTLSVNIDLDSNIFEGQKHTPREVKVLKPCFMKCVKGKHYFSSDYRKWKTFNEFFDTQLDASIDICDQTYIVKFTLHLDLHQKK